MALHTGPGCLIEDKITETSFSGVLSTGNCDVKAPGQDINSGCTIVAQDEMSYGDGFNAAGGGVYVTEWNSSKISIYYFARSKIPDDISTGSPTPSEWGTPLVLKEYQE